MISGNNYWPLLFARVGSLLCKYAYQIMEGCIGDKQLREFALTFCRFLKFFFFLDLLMISDLANMASLALITGRKKWQWMGESLVVHISLNCVFERRK